MRRLIRTFATALMFIGIFVGCLTALLLVVLMLRFPLLLIALLMACWLLSHQETSAQKGRQ